MKTVTLIAVILVIIGAINWGLVGLGYFVGANLNLVNLIVGKWAMVENIVYLAVGVAGVWKAWACMGKKCCKM